MSLDNLDDDGEREAQRIRNLKQGLNLGSSPLIQEKERQLKAVKAEISPLRAEVEILQQEILRLEEKINRRKKSLDEYARNEGKIASLKREIKESYANIKKKVALEVQASPVEGGAPVPPPPPPPPPPSPVGRPATPRANRAVTPPPQNQGNLVSEIESGRETLRPSTRKEVTLSQEQRVEKELERLDKLITSEQSTRDNFSNIFARKKREIDTLRDLDRQQEIVLPAQSTAQVFAKQQEAMAFLEGKRELLLNASVRLEQQKQEPKVQQEVVNESSAPPAPPPPPPLPPVPSAPKSRSGVREKGNPVTLGAEEQGPIHVKASQLEEIKRASQERHLKRLKEEVREVISGKTMAYAELLDNVLEKNGVKREDYSTLTEGKKNSIALDYEKSIERFIEARVEQNKRERERLENEKNAREEAEKTERLNAIISKQGGYRPLPEITEKDVKKAIDKVSKQLMELKKDFVDITEERLTQMTAKIVEVAEPSRVVDSPEPSDKIIVLSEDPVDEAIANEREPLSAGLFHQHALSRKPLLEETAHLHDLEESMQLIKDQLGVYHSMRSEPTANLVRVSLGMVNRNEKAKLARRAEEEIEQFLGNKGQYRGWSGEAKKEQLLNSLLGFLQEDYQLNQLGILKQPGNLTRIFLEAADTVKPGFSNSTRNPWKERGTLTLRDIEKNLGHYITHRGQPVTNQIRTSIGMVDRTKKVILARHVLEVIKKHPNHPEKMKVALKEALHDDYELNQKGFLKKQGELSKAILQALEKIEPGFQNSIDNPWKNKINNTPKR